MTRSSLLGVCKLSKKIREYTPSLSADFSPLSITFSTFSQSNVGAYIAWVCFSYLACSESFPLELPMEDCYRSPICLGWPWDFQMPSNSTIAATRDLQRGRCEQPNNFLEQPSRKVCRKASFPHFQRRNLISNESFPLRPLLASSLVTHTKRYVQPIRVQTFFLGFKHYSKWVHRRPGDRRRAGPTPGSNSWISWEEFCEITHVAIAAPVSYRELKWGKLAVFRDSCLFLL